jgi:hypothetical protein
MAFVKGGLPIVRRCVLRRYGVFLPAAGSRYAGWHRLTYLKWVGSLNCGYCASANGILACFTGIGARRPTPWTAPATEPEGPALGL